MAVSPVVNTELINPTVKNQMRWENQVRTLTGALTLLKLSAPMQYMDPGGAGRTITLPAEADSDGLVFVIVNTADAAELLTIENDGAATVVTIAQNESAMLFCDGTTWKGLVGASNPITGVAGGYAVARGVVTPTGGTTTVVTGLATVVSAVANIQENPTVTHMFSGADIGDQAGTPAAGSILINNSKPTAVNDVTPIAATTPWGAVNWVAVGTI